MLEELEHKYRLTFGIQPGNEEILFNKVKELIALEPKTWMSRNQALLQDKINVTAFLAWFISEYPASQAQMEKDPEYQYTFK